jgi:hypothetical protein
MQYLARLVIKLFLDPVVVDAFQPKPHNTLWFYIVYCIRGFPELALFIVLDIFGNTTLLNVFSLEIGRKMIKKLIILC